MAVVGPAQTLNGRDRPATPYGSFGTIARLSALFCLVSKLHASALVEKSWMLSMPMDYRAILKKKSKKKRRGIMFVRSGVKWS